MTKEYAVYVKPKQTIVHCPKHGSHTNVIKSNIVGHEGVWCQICWLDLLGPSLSSTEQEIEDAPL